MVDTESQRTRRRQRIRWTFRLATVALALAVGGVVVEIGLRLTWSERLPPAREVRSEWLDLPRIEPGPNLIFQVTQPNVRALLRGALFETNSAGFRGRERSIRKPPGTFRIVLIGDSITMGWGVNEEETYAGRAERRLNAERSGQRYEVLNMGVCGASTPDVLLQLEHKGLDFDPDMIIYGYSLNDLAGPEYRQITEPGLDSLSRYRNSPLYLWRLFGPRLETLRSAAGHPKKGSYLYESIQQKEEPLKPQS